VWLLVPLLALAVAACGSDDVAPGCGPSTCAGCVVGCTPADRCEAGSWVCECVCTDAGGSMDAGRGDSGPPPMDAASPRDAPAPIDAPMSLDAPAPFDAADCTATNAAAVAFVEAHKSCSVDSDCVQVAAPCYSMPEDCCVTYMKADYDTVAWASLYAAVTSCAGGACACCASIPAPPGCIGGRCAPNR